MFYLNKMLCAFSFDCGFVLSFYLRKGDGYLNISVSDNAHDTVGNIYVLEHISVLYVVIFQSGWVSYHAVRYLQIILVNGRYKASNEIGHHLWL